MRAVIVVTHGSRRQEFLDDLETLAKSLKGDGYDVVLAHNEYSFPDWREVLKDLVRKGYDEIVFALAFLGRGNHVFRDIAGSLGVSELEKWKEIEVEGKRVKVYFTRPLANSPLVRTALKLRVLRAFTNGERKKYVTDPEEIEERSMGIAKEFVKRERPDLDEANTRIAARLVYTSGNPEIAKHYFSSEDAVEVALEALRGNVLAVTDVKMVEAGLRWGNKACALDYAITKIEGYTRTALGLRLAVTDNEGAKAVVVGNAPTAVAEAMKLAFEGEDIAFIVATPPGFTNAKEVKEELVNSGIPSFVVRGSYGGSNLAVAIFNELVRMEWEHA